MGMKRNHVPSPQNLTDYRLQSQRHTHTSRKLTVLRRARAAKF